MFGMKKGREKAVSVKTVEELNAAIKRKEACIEVRGDLVRKLGWIKKLTKIQIVGLAALLASAVIPSPVAPIAGISFLAAATPMAAISSVTGTEIAKIILATGISASLVLAILKGYDAEIQKDKVVLTKK